MPYWRTPAAKRIQQGKQYDDSKQQEVIRAMHKSATDQSICFVEIIIAIAIGTSVVAMFVREEHGTIPIQT